MKEKKENILSIRVEKKLYDFLSKQAEKNFITISSIVHKMVVDYYEKHKFT